MLQENNISQGTTPTFSLILPSTVDLTQAEHIVFTMSQGNAIVEKFDTDLTITEAIVDLTNRQTIVNVYLTQADTLRFQHYAEAKIQLNWIYSDGSRACTAVKAIKIDENLHKAVIS